MKDILTLGGFLIFLHCRFKSFNFSIFLVLFSILLKSIKKLITYQPTIINISPSKRRNFRTLASRFHLKTF